MAESQKDGFLLVMAGTTKPNGYGQFMRWIEGRWRPDYAHIAAYELLNGPVDRTLDMDHECMNKLCVRPAPGHVVQVTRIENRKRQFQSSLVRDDFGRYASRCR